ncbi:MAG TPA: IclR family transcriptional regulator [Alphaproteobacteria bacterium]|nr:IclR family transcriptional regulator [Alphaproteobacteria bacterium]
MVAAVDRCLALIETLAQEAEGLSLGDIAARLDMPKSATHRMLATLAAHGYVTQDPATQAYLLSLRLAVLAFRYLDARRLPDVAQTVLDRLARDTAEYCRLAVVEGDGLIWVARAQGATRGLRYDPEMGHEVVLHATATGKAWLATLQEEEALRIVFAQGFRAPPNAGKRVVRTVDELRTHLAETRRRGYAVAVEEGEAGTVAVAVTFRAWDSPEAPVAGTLSVAGPMVRLGRERREEIGAALIAAAREVAALWPLRQRQRHAARQEAGGSLAAAAPRAAGMGEL